MPSLTPSEEAYLRKIYYDPGHPVSYQSPYRLYKFAKSDGQHDLKLDDVKSWIQRQETYSLNKNVLRNFERSRVLVLGIDDQWEADLASLDDYASDNKGYKYLLCVIDVFSRYAWVQPLKSKLESEIVKAFLVVLNDGRKPQRLRTDAATDFTSKAFQQFVKEEKIVHFVTHNEKQANYVERFIQTIKRKIFRYIVGKNTPMYIDVLQKFVDSYNKTFHSGIQCEPENVTKKNERKLWYQMYWPKQKANEQSEEFEPGDKKKKRKPVVKKKVGFAFNIGDTVRITYIRSAFHREYSAHWSREMFKVSDRMIRQKQPVYKLNDWSGEPTQGTFYEYELQKTEPPKTWKIEKVIKKQGRRALVEWKGWPKKFNSWVPLSDIKRLNKKKRRRRQVR